MKKGFTLVEMLVVLGISVVLILMIVTGFYSFRQNESVDKDANLLRSLIEQARFQTISEKDGYTYGVHFATTTAIIFRGTTYSAGDANNQPLTWDPSIQLSQISLTASTSNITFSAISGEPSATGTLKMTSTANSQRYTIITVYSSGIIE